MENTFLPVRACRLLLNNFWSIHKVLVGIDDLVALYWESYVLCKVFYFLYTHTVLPDCINKIFISPKNLNERLKFNKDLQTKNFIDTDDCIQCESSLFKFSEEKHPDQAVFSQQILPKQLMHGHKISSLYLDHLVTSSQSTHWTQLFNYRKII